MQSPHTCHFFNRPSTRTPDCVIYPIHSILCPQIYKCWAHITCEYIIGHVDEYNFISQIELSKYVAVNTATAHAHYEGEATYNIGSSFKGRPHFNIIKIHPQIGNGGESIGDITV